MKNLAFIQTFNHYGSGVVFPCKWRNKNTCFILTNYHVVRDLTADGTDKKEYVNLEFHDKFGKRIKEEFICAVYVAHGAVCDNESDVAALLVELDNAVCLPSNFEEEILWEEPDEEDVCSVGYPNILQEDDVNHRLMIEGKTENTFPLMKKMGIYKITDNYHWYEYMSDRDLFEGFSGGPVYMNKDRKRSLVGINQSLCNTGEGNNPFKLVYFIKIKQAFELLRESGIILYKYKDGKIEIEWIGEPKKSEIIETKRSVNILLLGGSGSGKSSFVKELMLHGEEVNASGDGQTTRMDVEYHLEICCKQPKVKVEFYNQKDFVDKMIELTSINRITYLFQSKYGFPNKNLEEDIFAYLRTIYQPLELLSDILKGKESLEKDKEEKDNIFDEISREMNLINSAIRKGDDAEREEIIEIYKELLVLLEKICSSEELPVDSGRISAIFREDWQECYQKNMHKEGKNTKNQNDITLEQYIRFILDLEKGKIEKYRCEPVIEQEIFDVLNICKGFFDIRELYFLFDEKNEVDAYIHKLVGEHSNFFGIDTVDENITQNYDGTNKESEKSILGEYYQNLYKYIYNRVQSFLEINNILETELLEISEKERENISLCLKVTGGKSLTGMVKKIDITDSISNEYALMVKRCGITNLELIDTCGLDHIERGTGIKRLLQKKFITYSENGIRLDAVFYLKKLDAGRPAELERILPILYNIAPDQPIFNIFTGADIFYRGKEEYLINFPWNKELYDIEKKDELMRIPKSMAYFYDNVNIVKKLPCSKERQNDLYKIIRNNLMPFVADTEKRKNSIFAESNRFYLKKVLNVILSDEWNSGYIDQTTLIDMLRDQEIIDALDEDIHSMFLAASLFEWKNRHHMTVNANLRRISGKVEHEKYMGYNGTFFDRWDNLLRKGFQEAFLKNKSEVIQVFDKKGISKNQSERMFGKLRDIIVDEDLKYNKDYDKEESKFRIIFKKMYGDKNCFKYNPYEEEEVLMDQQKKREYLADICEFQKGLKNEKIKNEFRELFIEEIRSYAEAENERRIEKLWENRPDFRVLVNEVIEEMKEIAGTQDDNFLTKMFQIFLRLNMQSNKGNS